MQPIDLRGGAVILAHFKVASKSCAKSFPMSTYNLSCVFFEGQQRATVKYFQMYHIYTKVGSAPPPLGRWGRYMLYNIAPSTRYACNVAAALSDVRRHSDESKKRMELRGEGKLCGKKAWKTLAKGVNDKNVGRSR